MNYVLIELGTHRKSYMSHWAVLHDSSFHSHTVLLFDKTNAAQSTGSQMVFKAEGLHVFSFNLI